MPPMRPRRLRRRLKGCKRGCERYARQVTAAKGKHGQKRKTPVEEDASKVDAPKLSGGKRGQKRKNLEAELSEPKAKAARICGARIKDAITKITSEPWRPPVVQMSEVQIED